MRLGITILALFVVFSSCEILESRLELKSSSEATSVSDNKWKGDVITFKFCDKPHAISKFSWETAHQAAINQWANVIPIEFKRVTKGHADIEVTLDKIDGPNGRVAITWPPKDNNDVINGDIHLDNSEFWYSSYRPSFLGSSRKQSNLVGPDSYIDIYVVMLHNYGLAIGMLENDDKTSVMYSDYRYDDINALSSNDTKDIQSLYGVRDGPAFTVVTTTTTTTTTTSRPPQTTTVEAEGGYDRCADGNIDAITISSDGEAYAFRGVHYFKLRHRYHLPLTTELIEDGWPGLPDFIDAAVYLDNRRDYQNAPEGTYFFKGFKVYRYMGRQLQKGYPKLIEELFPGIPYDLDSIFKIGGRLLARKGLKCYEVETPFVSRGFPCNISGTLLANLESPGIDAAFYWPRYGNTYYFSGTQYWRLTSSLKADPSYPKSTKKYFLGCR